MPSVRRIADVAWSGGAVPIIVVAHDPDGTVAAALAGAPVTLAEPAPAEAGPAGQMVRGIEVALDEVRDTSGALIWPARMAWVGPETVTSMIEAHGPSRRCAADADVRRDAGLAGAPATRGPGRAASGRRGPMPPPIPARARRGRGAAAAPRPRRSRHDPRPRYAPLGAAAVHRPIRAGRRARPRVGRDDARTIPTTVRSRARRSRRTPRPRRTSTPELRSPGCSVASRAAVRPGLSRARCHR